MHTVTVRDPSKGYRHWDDGIVSRQKYPTCMSAQKAVEAALAKYRGTGFLVSWLGLAGPPEVGAA